MSFGFSRSRPLLMVGCGKMGQALVRGWRQAGLPAEALCVYKRSPESIESFRRELGFHCASDFADLFTDASPAAICLANKPAGMAEVLEVVRTHAAESDALVFSVAAGLGSAFYEARLWPQARFIRVMPNTPSSIGEGMSGCFANRHATPADTKQIDHLMRTVGETLWLEDEAALHTLTAISGSGPAYVFYLLEEMIRAGSAYELSEEQVRRLVCQTFVGASKMALQSQEAISQLRNNVTSPNGTTAAGLDALMQESLSVLFQDSVDAARTRSIAIEQEQDS